MPHSQLYMARKTVPETQTWLAVPFPPTSFLLLVDGTSFLLQTDGTSRIGLSQA